MKYLLFTTPMCSNCPSMKEFMTGVKMQGEFVDASTDDGLKKASDFGVSSVPTVLFLDDGGKVVSEAHTVNDARAVIDKEQ